MQGRGPAAVSFAPIEKNSWIGCLLMTFLETFVNYIPVVVAADIAVAGTVDPCIRRLGPSSSFDLDPWEGTQHTSAVADTAFVDPSFRHYLDRIPTLLVMEVAAVVAGELVLTSLMIREMASLFSAKSCYNL